jgi:hypothetical protein
MTFPSIRIEGAILSADLLSRLESGDLGGQRPVDFGVETPAALKDDIVRAWTHAQAYHRAFRDKLEALKPGATGTTETRNLFVIPFLALLGYGDLEFSKPETVGDKSFPISHRLPSRDWFAVHIIGARESLDKPPASGSGPRTRPHALVQEYLNLTEHLYALVTNGRLLRLLRDSTRLIKLSYVEFDLDRIFAEELFADFAVLYRLLHVSRLPKSRADAPQSLVERYHQDALDSGARIRDGLSVAVAEAMQELGSGFLARTPALQSAVADGSLAARDFHHGILRLIYRLLFLMVAEERGLLFPPDADPRRRRIYHEHYSLARLRRLAERRALVEPTKPDLWRSLLSTFRLFEVEGAGAPLGLTALCGHLFAPEALGPLATAELDNGTLLSALARLSLFRDPKTGQRVRVNYGALATEEFGSVYESLLELHPVFLDGTPPRFTFKQAAGNERKTTGSYYTPSSLVECLLDSALDPVVEQRLAGKKGADAEQAILSLKVCDPAVGSGHFLIAAGHRLARRLATLRSGDDEPSPDQLRHALREVISHCLYGVDVNPMSVELCKVTLWLEATEPGKPLSFLDHHIQCGNSLLGATPRVLADGLPDDAFKPIEGDDKTVCTEAKKRNKSERQQLALFHGTETAPWQHLGNLPAAMLAVGTMSDDTADALHRKEQRYAELIRSTGYLSSRFLADAWCAAFVWKKTRDLPYPITNDVLRKIERNPHDCAPWMREEIERLRDRYQFFHWHLAFPEVFPVPVNGERPANKDAGWNGGFDVMLGNPPWERVKLQEKEWFAERRPDIAEAPNAAARKRLIERLAQDDPALHAAFGEALRKADGESHMLRDTGLFPLCACGDVNLYAVFAESIRRLLGPIGRMGAVLPSGIATDDTTKLFFRAVTNSRSLVSLFDFENKGIFPGVHNSYKFCLFVAGSGITALADAAEFVFYAHGVDELHDPERRFTLNAEDIALVNPNSRTCPIFRVRRDAELAKSVYRRVPVLIREGTPGGNPWGVKFTTMFHMTADGSLFRTREQLQAEGCKLHGNRFRNGEDWFPVLEGKMVGAYDHRAANIELCLENALRQQQPAPTSLAEREDPMFANQPYLWGPESEGRERTPEDWNHEWFLAFKRVTAATNERTIVGCIIPWTTASYTLYLVTCVREHQAALPCLAANFFSFVGDFFVRQKTSQPSLPMGVIYEAAFLPPATYADPCAWAGQPAVTLRDWLLPRVLELTYTAWDLEPFARDSGWFGPPFVWDEARRFQLRCELDAAFLHLYGLSRADAAYILDTFPIVRRKDEAAHGTYRTRDTILALYDQFAEASTSGKPFVSHLDPPPGNIRACHPPRPAIPTNA